MSRVTSPLIFAVLYAACQLAAAAAADEARVLAAVRKAYPATTFDRAARTPMPGVYEIWMGENVAFVSARNPRYMVFGRLVDLKTMRDLTAPKVRIAQQSAATTAGESVAPIDVGQMPVADAVTVVRGLGRRSLSIFTDPACAYCRQLEGQLQKLTDVTIRYYLVPFQGGSVPLAIWCARDRHAAYVQAMTGHLPADVTQTSCEHPLDRNVSLARRLRVHATPTLLFSDGRTIPGVMTAEELEARLSVGGPSEANNVEGGSHAATSLEK